MRMPVVAPLINLLQQEVLTDEGVSDCQKVIYNLIRSVEIILILSLTV